MSAAEKAEVLVTVASSPTPKRKVLQRAWSRPEHLLPVAEAEGAARTGE